MCTSIATWQLPGGKLWHCVDHIVMRQRQRRFCHDVSVLRRADCWTDHRLLRAKLFLANAHHAPRQPIRKRFAVYKLNDDGSRHAFVEGVLLKIRSNWSEDMPAGKMWTVLKDGILESGRNILGTDGRRQPDWFRDNAEVLKPLLNSRNAMPFLLVGFSLNVIGIDRDMLQKEELSHRLFVPLRIIGFSRKLRKLS